ncbi:hypothetical protein JCM19233_1402 [Vibrio astriarenae]|nr:hypothetical protein JCM19233_1402 [Vibrio sp. C7]
MRAITGIISRYFSMHYFIHAISCHTKNGTAIGVGQYSALKPV